MEGVLPTNLPSIIMSAPSGVDLTVRLANSSLADAEGLAGGAAGWEGAAALAVGNWSAALAETEAGSGGLRWKSIRLRCMSLLQSSPGSAWNR